MNKSHKEWRKIAKKERRRKIRVKLASEKDKIFDNEEYLLIEQMELESIEKSNEEENEKWLQAEKRSMEAWEKLQERKRILCQQKLEQEAKIQLEWEMEQQRLKEEAERMKQLEEENRLKQEKFLKSLDDYLNGDSTKPPKELLVIKESRAGAEMCPFFSKTACCRFGDQCSRNHQYPGISQVLLATNFYTHFGLSNSTQNEYDTDIMLEYEDNETYKEFKEFFYDILTEFEKFGKITQLQKRSQSSKHRESERSIRTPTPRSWRWSESPEVEIPRKSKKSKDSERSRRKSRERESRDRESSDRRSHSKRSRDRTSERR